MKKLFNIFNKESNVKMKLVPILQIFFGAIILLFGIYTLYGTYISPGLSFVDLNNELFGFAESRSELVEIYRENQNLTSLEEEILLKEYLSDVNQFFAIMNFLSYIFVSIQLLLIALGIMLLLQGLYNLRTKNL